MKKRAILVIEQVNNFYTENVAFRFDIIKNGKPDYLELDIFNFIEELEKNNKISIRKIYNMFKAKYGLDIGDIIYYKNQKNTIKK